jgi:thioredoxin 1
MIKAFNYETTPAKGFSVMSATESVTDNSFKKDVLESEVPVLVDFWAPWCGPCRMVAPVVEDIATSPDYQGKLKVVKLNTDENPKTASDYGIRSIPTLMIFKGGQKVDTVVGAVPKTTLSNTLDKWIDG